MKKKFVAPAQFGGKYRALWSRLVRNGQASVAPPTGVSLNGQATRVRAAAAYLKSVGKLPQFTVSVKGGRVWVALPNFQIS